MDSSSTRKPVKPSPFGVEAISLMSLIHTYHGAFIKFYCFLLLAEHALLLLLFIGRELPLKWRNDSHLSFHTSGSSWLNFTCISSNFLNCRVNANNSRYVDSYAESLFETGRLSSLQSLFDRFHTAFSSLSENRKTHLGKEALHKLLCKDVSLG